MRKDSRVQGRNQTFRVLIIGVFLVLFGGITISCAPDKQDSKPPITKEMPQTKEPEGEEPKAEERKAKEPKTKKPKAEEPKAKEPKAEEPKAKEPKAKEPKAEEPKAEEPKAEEPKAEEPKAKDALRQDYDSLAKSKNGSDNAESTDLPTPASAKIGPSVEESSSASPNMVASGESLDRPTIQLSLDPNVDEVGVSLGYLADPGDSGDIFKRFEASLLMGINSSDGVVVNPRCMASEKNQEDSRTDRMAGSKDCSERVSPWRFSGEDSSQEFLNSLESIENQLVLIYYKKYRVAPLTKTNRIVSQVIPVQPSIVVPSQPYYDASDHYPISMHLNYKRGYVDGRIVNAALVGDFPPHHEVIVQKGASGNDFQRMSVSDEGLFNYIVEAMATGRLLRIHNIRYYGVEGGIAAAVWGYDTYYRIDRVDILEDAPTQNTME